VGDGFVDCLKEFDVNDAVKFIPLIVNRENEWFVDGTRVDMAVIDGV
jgi:hypothetical protein